jgi:tRNA nucleotidyltransferase (CCA-adding enzyme)
VSPTHPIHGADETIARLGRLPGGPELLAQAGRRGDVALVGGAVRDLLLGHWPRELDVTVGSDAAGLAEALAAAISPSERAYGRIVKPVLHERFRTASVAWAYGRVDVAELRAESYPAPGALPEVRPGSVEEDLARRDFTVNAISLPLAGDGVGLLSVHGALEDLATGTLRVLHERSFLDDPTRILRLARYAGRLGFTIEPDTRQLAEEALAGGALRTVSGGRIGSELWLAAGESNGRAALRVLDELGALAALGMPTPFDDALAAAAEALLPADGAREVLLMGVALHPSDDDSASTAAGALRVMDQLEFSREATQRVFPVANGVVGLAEEVLRAESPISAHGVLDGRSVETASVTGVLAARRSVQTGEWVREWLETVRHVRLEINGEDLLAAGVSEGPELGLRLRAAMRSKREGRANGKDEELRAALEYQFKDPTWSLET